ncbi:MAG: tetratricopeptide repeat protein [Smithellaceae bacterium]|nr:tetratricopeptide repeat protein [Smithellaceae bacterium]
MKKPVSISIVLLLLLTLVPSVPAETKTFIKEYTYQASDFDSKISSRAIALEQAKRLLLEEVGSYLISETNVKDFQLTKDRITALTGGIVQTEILDEKWDGKTYYLKAKMTVDPDEVAKSLEGMKQNSQKSRELEETNRKIDEALKKIKKLQDDLAAGKATEGRQQEYSKVVDELKAKEWIDKGVALMNSEDYNGALAAFENAARANPESPWAFIDKGWAYNSLGYYDQALKEFDRAAALDPKNLWIYVNRGHSYNSQGDYRHGLIEENKAIEFDPNVAWAYIDRGWSYTGLGNFAQALVDLNRAEQLDPQIPYIYSSRVWAHNGLGNHSQALDDLQKSLNISPNNSWMRWNAAAYYALSGNKSRALSELKKAVSLNASLKQRSKIDRSFQSLWDDEDFRRIVD